MNQETIHCNDYFLELDLRKLFQSWDNIIPLIAKARYDWVITGKYNQLRLLKDVSTHYYDMRITQVHFTVIQELTLGNFEVMMIFFWRPHFVKGLNQIPTFSYWLTIGVFIGVIVIGLFLFFQQMINSWIYSPFHFAFLLWRYIDHWLRHFIYKI